MKIAIPIVHGLSCCCHYLVNLPLREGKGEKMPWELVVKGCLRKKMRSKKEFDMGWSQKPLYCRTLLKALCKSISKLCDVSKPALSICHLEFMKIPISLGRLVSISFPFCCFLWSYQKSHWEEQNSFLFVFFLTRIFLLKWECEF